MSLAVSIKFCYYLLSFILFHFFFSCEDGTLRRGFKKKWERKIKILNWFSSYEGGKDGIVNAIVTFATHKICQLGANHYR